MRILRYYDYSLKDRYTLYSIQSSYDKYYSQQNNYLNLKDYNSLIIREIKRSLI